MAVDVSVRDLVRSYASLRDAVGQSAGPGGRLLRFYSVECGLKAAYLGKRGTSARGTESLPQELRSHDLRRLAKALNLGQTYLDGLSACRRRQSQRGPVDHHELHQAWRYGAALDENDEKSAVSALDKLSDWCREEHRK
ncbi:hypothetical protein [Frankia sp. CiP1_Cm_nod1]|uniref:hypothetical protein n=1 Tax=Frankia sp. CiP1_Cm_nod1 TaxID=2897160 RepID=UPI00202527AE